ncbi:MAG TPA: SagB family peptide dehydrogenase [Chloroflexota bacterium]
MAHPLVLQFRPGTSLVEETGEQVTIRCPAGTLPVRELTPGLRAALRTLAADGATEDALSDLIIEHDGTSGLPVWYYHVQCWADLCLLAYGMLAAGTPLATLVPMTRDFTWRTLRDDPATRYQLSRFAYVRRLGDALVLESPLAPARTVLHGARGLAAVGALTRATSVKALAATLDGMALDTVATLLRLLVSAGAVDALGADDALPEDAAPALAQWEFHDLLFHARSRLGRHDDHYGGTFRFLDQLPPLPAVKPPMSAEPIPLYRPDLALVEQADPPLTRVLETRRSVRQYAARPLTLRQLGEFLYRVARVRQVIPIAPERRRHYEVTRRPYPSGGATYDLELYVTVNTCVDLPAGLYHYDPLAHALHPLADRSADVEALLRDARGAAKLAFTPQVVITLASRFQRLSWKYTAMAYATTLKNVGALYQTMYLVATAMGLAPCALGGGNSDRFAAVAGTDYYAETSVGEFLLGSLPPDVEEAAPAPAERGTNHGMGEAG